MAEKIVSPGVFTKEIDASFLPSAIGEIGAAIVGPTVKGPAMVPTVVESYADYQATFGDVVQSGSNYYQYLTSVTAANYLKHGGRLTVVRVLDGSFGGANASIPITGSITTTAATLATGSVELLASIPSASAHELTINGVDFVGVLSSSIHDNSDAERYVTIGATVDTFGSELATVINAASSSAGVSLTNVTAEYISGTNLLKLSGSSYGTSANVTVATSSITGNDQAIFTAFTSSQGGTDSSTTSTGNSFKLNTHSHGSIQNNSSSIAQKNNILLSGSAANVRWEISSINEAKGTFSLLIRRGDDTNKRKQILETWNNLSLDPNEGNYINKVIGDSYAEANVSDPTDVFIEYKGGDFPPKSKYVYVSETNDTVNYLNENGELRLNSQSGSLPKVGSGSYDGAFEGASDGWGGFDNLGNPQNNFTGSAVQFYGDIGSDNYQGFKLASTTSGDGGSAYIDALNLLSNADEYDINMLLIPGIFDVQSDGCSGIVDKAIDVCEDRGDCFLIYDTVLKSETNLKNVTTEAQTRDSNYAATYWPWVQVADNQTGNYRWVPPSVVMAGIYAFNDKVAAPWFAPAGLNRGGLDTVIQAARKLTHSNRDVLYESNVNPIATFPGQGVVVWGQKTLQKKSSALDRVNVRRLLIKVKKFIAASSRFLVFEQNNAQTRNRFLNIANPYLEQVQSQSGLNAFKVVMDESNNTPDIVDRNILYGQIFLQPTRTAEFIVLDFTIQPTGAAFPE